MKPVTIQELVDNAYIWYYQYLGGMSNIHRLQTITDTRLEVVKLAWVLFKILGAGRLRFITWIREAYRVLFNISVYLYLRY